MSEPQKKNLGPHQYCGCTPCCMCIGLDWCQITRKSSWKSGPACVESNCPNTVMFGGERCFPHVLGLPVKWLDCPSCGLSDHAMRDDSGPGIFCHRCDKRYQVKPEHWSIVSTWEKKRQFLREKAAKRWKRKQFVN